MLTGIQRKRSGRYPSVFRGFLGFEHPQSFNKLFKNKTSLTPLEFRTHYN